ncbi:MAG: decaprenyl-phosphate phosphoribosyltransferase [Chloroflexota bacterium]|nr:decaprenyl-phosphate phosphoribosyltransferase [Chloroflexota bacterium]
MRTTERPPTSEITTMDLALGLLRELRPKQWTKNALVFAGLVFDMKLFDLGALATSISAFLIFCAISSAAYVINDLADLERDRRHPVKRRRPIASGLLSVGLARVAVVVLLAVALPVAFLLSWQFALVALTYFVTVLIYSFVLKHVVLLDVFAIASGFVLRAVAGTVVLAVSLSPWLLVCTVLLSLFLALAKRRHELLLLEGGAGGHRQILDEYSERFLDQMIAIVTSSTVIAYSLYTFQAAGPPDDHSMMLTIPFVLYALFRYLYLIHQRNEGGSPETLLLKDRPLLVTILLWALVVVTVLYRPWAV